jgi:protein SCO1/2
VRDIAPFNLTDHRGERFDRERLLGRWTLVTFGFTSCPDACPTMLTNFAELRKSLVATWKGPEPQFVFVTVDPARDTPQVLSQYVPSFDPAFLGATATQAEIDRMHADIGGAHRIPAKAHQHANGKAHTHYNVDHSVLLYIINPAGRLHAQIAPPFDPAGVAGQIGRFARDFAGSRPAATTASPGKV